MTIAPVPDEVRSKVEAALRALGKAPTVADCRAIATSAGCSASTVRRIAGRGVAEPAEEPPVLQPEPSSASKATPAERVSPAVTGQQRGRSRPRTYVSEECCGEAWSLEPGEAVPNTCPACGEPFQ